MKIRTIAFAGAVLGIILSPIQSRAASASDPVAASEYGQSTDARAPKRDRDNGQTRPLPRRKPSPPAPGQSARGPAYKEECVWVGKRVVSLLARDDAMAANDFMPFYSQFGCPQEHIAKAFACVVTNKDPSENEALADRIDICWDNTDAEFPATPPAEEPGGGKDSESGKPAEGGASPNGM